MKHKLSFLILSVVLVFNAIVVNAKIDPEVIKSTVESIAEKYPGNRSLIEKGVAQVAESWREDDGSDSIFREFCEKNYVGEAELREAVFLRISDYMEALYGYNTEMSRVLGWNITINTGPIYEIDQMFNSYRPMSGMTNDLYRNKIAFFVKLNFPKLTFEEKQELGLNRKELAYARMGELFITRPGSRGGSQEGTGAGTSNTGNVREKYKPAKSGDQYVADYNIYMGHLLSPKGKKIFPENMILLSHWNLRDEIKSNYSSKGGEGLEKQKTVQRVMERIISQEIPVEVINSPDYDWDPFKNEIYKEGEKVKQYTKEGDVRYQYMVNNLINANSNSEKGAEEYLDDRFIASMEMTTSEMEKMFHDFLTAPQLKELGKLVSKRLGRNLEAFDIWYDGFKPRSTLDEESLSQRLREMYPDAAAMERDLPAILEKLGFSLERALDLGSKIAVDNARGSGHAAGASMKGAKARLRTRIPEGGMDYKGFNIAIHEFGHNVEQTISLYEVDYYMLRGVPNTAFTEALAFIFQKRDLDILGIENNDPDRETLEVFDKAWSLFEIIGVSMVDVAMWRWMLNNPDVTAEQLRDQVITISKEIWNRYYAPVFGIKDQTILAIYSHMIHYPLYMPSYAFGHIIQFQLEQYLEGKDFADEVTRMYRIGKLTPTQWMMEATGSPISTQPVLDALTKGLNNFNR